MGGGLRGRRGFLPLLGGADAEGGEGEEGKGLGEHFCWGVLVVFWWWVVGCCMWTLYLLMRGDGGDDADLDRRGMLGIDIRAACVARHWWCARSSIVAQHAIDTVDANSPNLHAVCLMGRR